VFSLLESPCRNATGKAWLEIDYSCEIVQIDSDTHYFKILIRGHTGYPLPVRGKFRRKGAWTWLGRLGGWTKTSGDPLFDRVVIGKEFKGSLGRILDSEGMQSAIMDLLGGGLGLSLTPDGVHVHGDLGEQPFEPELIREVMVIMIHLDQYCQLAQPRG
jgi:hypothetical protein